MFVVCGGGGFIFVGDLFFLVLMVFVIIGWIYFVVVGIVMVEYRCNGIEV